MKFKQLLKNRLYLIAIFTILGIALLLSAQASSNAISIEPEKEVKSASIKDISDNSASNLQAIEFKQANNTPPGQFIRKIDTGPQASTFGHTPYGQLKKWSGSNNITESSAPRDPDGWMRLKGYEFTGSIKINVPNVELSDCKVTAGSGNPSSNGMIYSSSSMPAGDMLIDHCIVDQGPTGLSAAAINVYQPINMVVRYSLILGSGDGIKANSNGLYENNYINITGQGTVTSPGHIDGIQGSFYKVNWTARHNTIISGIGQAPNGGSYREERGGNIGIWGALDGAPYNYGVVAEDNYIDGFNAGISLQGTDSSNPNIVRRNTFGKNFRYYPSLRIRTWTEYPHTVVENNNVYDKLFNEDTGQAEAY